MKANYHEINYRACVNTLWASDGFQRFTTRAISPTLWQLSAQFCPWCCVVPSLGWVNHATAITRQWFRSSWSRVLSHVLHYATSSSKAKLQSCWEELWIQQWYEAFSAKYFVDQATFVYAENNCSGTILPEHRISEIRFQYRAYSVLGVFLLLRTVHRVEHFGKYIFLLLFCWRSLLCDNSSGTGFLVYKTTFLYQAQRLIACCCISTICLFYKGGFTPFCVLQSCTLYFLSLCFNWAKGFPIDE